MSNRSKWAHWNKPKPERHPLLMKWTVGIVSIVLGGLLVLAGLQGLHDNILWYEGFSFKLGAPVIRQTTGLIVLGAVLFLGGITTLVVRK
jgi:hypothetical protein